MILKKFLLISFADAPKKKPKYVIEVPDSTSTKLLKAIVLHDGIYLWYELSELIASSQTRLDEFVVVPEGKVIPEGATLVDILDVRIDIPDKPDQQGIIIYSIFKL